MKILLTGANGFIGRYIVADLLRRGHDVVPAVRDPARMDRLLPAPASIRVDLNTDTSSEDWTPRLVGIDAVINCAGVLQATPFQSIDAIHGDAPKALFAACELCGVRRVVQVSAISAVPEANTAYARSKLVADEYLKATDLEWAILKPSLVYAAGAYGGTALLRGLASLPAGVPVVGNGDQPFRPLHVDDLCEAIARLLEPDNKSLCQVIALVGPDRLTLGDILVDLRRWLGYRPVSLIRVPPTVARVMARLGDVFGGTMNSTALRQLEFGNAGEELAHGETRMITKRKWHDFLVENPSQVQDRWHGRLYFLRPTLRWAIALTWIASGLVGLSQPRPLLEATIGKIGFDETLALPLVVAACGTDIAIGMAVIARRRPHLVASIQAILVIAYTFALTVALPSLWSDPFGSLLKNLVFLTAIGVLAAMERDR